MSLKRDLFISAMTNEVEEEKKAKLSEMEEQSKRMIKQIRQQTRKNSLLFLAQTSFFLSSKMFCKLVGRKTQTQTTILARNNK